MDKKDFNYIKEKFDRIELKIADYCKDESHRTSLLNLKDDQLKNKVEEIIGNKLPTDLHINLVADSPKELTIAIPPTSQKSTMDPETRAW